MARRIELVSVLVASVVAVAGLWYSNVQTQQTNEQMRQANIQAQQERTLAREGQITDRYTAAVVNLGDDNVDVRLGGIYALQRIMQDSHRDHPTIANVLATYIRTHAAKPPAKGTSVPSDSLAALSVLANRDITQDDTFILDLSSVWLPNADVIPAGSATVGLRNVILSDAHLAGAHLSFLDLSHARLYDADLRGAVMRGADLNWTVLWGADLRRAVMPGADLNHTVLRSADLRGADLRNADLRDALLEGADLNGADLRNAERTRESGRAGEP